MSLFVLRNSTVELLFGSKDVSFSGYGDISFIDPESHFVVWFYLLPFKSDSKILTQEVASYFSNIKFIFPQLSQNQIFIIITLYQYDLIKYESSDFGLESAIVKFNNDVIDFAKQNNRVKIIDFSEFAKHYSSDQLIDWKFYFISKNQINPKLSNFFRRWFDHKMEEIKLKRKKCLILDLDNTLWGGILGEDGISGIKIGEDYPGNAFLMFHEYILELAKNGVILAICSKNNEKDVLDLWEKNPFILLKKEIFTAYRINWKNKADNIIALGEELNIGLDSMVFIDDNPAERELIKQLLPMVEVPDFPSKPYLLPKFAQCLINDYFRIYTLTSEDKAKIDQYRSNAERNRALSNFTDFSDYLRSLEIRLKIDKANTFHLDRIAQMTQKTNQFNLTTRRYTIAEIQNLISQGHSVYYLSVQDKFGDNGITGLLIAKLNKKEKIVFIDTFLLSCRILGKGIEKAFLGFIINKVKEQGFEIVESLYIPTLKNLQVRNFYDSLGFERLERDGIEESTKYRIDIRRIEFLIETYYTIE